MGLGWLGELGAATGGSFVRILGRGFVFGDGKRERISTGAFGIAAGAIGVAGGGKSRDLRGELCAGFFDWREKIRARGESGAGAEEYVVDDLSGAGVCESFGGVGTDVLCGVAQCLEFLAAGAGKEGERTHSGV